MLLDRLGRVVGQARAPAAMSAPARPASPGAASFAGHQHVRQAERQHAFGAGPHRHPLVGVRAGLRHARFDLHERAANAAAALPHRAVGVALRHRRVPGAEEVGAEAEDEARVGQVEGRQLRRGRSSARWRAAARRRRTARRPPAPARRSVARNCCTTSARWPVPRAAAGTPAPAGCRRPPARRARRPARRSRRPTRSPRTSPSPRLPDRFSGCVIRSG